MTTPIPQETPKELEIKTASTDIITQATALKITTLEDAELAADYLGTLKDGYNDAETERKAIVKPFNDGVKAINARFKKITTPISDAMGAIKTELLRFDDEQQKLRDQAALAVAEKLEEEGNDVSADITLKTAQIAAPKVQSNSGNTASVRKTWDFEVEDIKAFANAHPEMVEVKATAVRALIRTGTRDLAGLKITQKKSIAAR